MKKLVFLSLILVNGLLLGQANETANYSISAKIGRSIPIQGSYLKDNWNGGPYISLEFIKKYNPVDFILSCDYEYFSLAGDKIKYVNPHFGILRSFKKAKFSLVPSITIGYTWLNYTNGLGIIMDTPIPVQEYSQNGFSASFDLKFHYDVSDKLQIGIGDSYMNIFESFGPTDRKPDNSKFIGLNRTYLSVLFKI